MAVEIGSKMPALNKYGQNGATNASGDLPGQKTTSGFLPGCEVPKDDWQTRKLTGSNVADTPSLGKRGIDDGSPGGTVPGKSQWNDGPLPSRNKS